MSTPSVRPTQHTQAPANTNSKANQISTGLGGVAAAQEFSQQQTATHNAAQTVLKSAVYVSYKNVPSNGVITKKGNEPPCHTHIGKLPNAPASKPSSGSSQPTKSGPPRRYDF